MQLICAFRICKKQVSLLGGWFDMFCPKIKHISRLLSTNVLCFYTPIKRLGVYTRDANCSVKDGRKHFFPLSSKYLSFVLFLYDILLNNLSVLC